MKYTQNGTNKYEFQVTQNIITNIELEDNCPYHSHHRKQENFFRMTAEV